MTNPSSYLNNIVYHRKGTNVVVPETDANKNDVNLAPMTVHDAIQLGYIEAPKSMLTPQPEAVSTSQLQRENEKLRDLIRQLQSDIREMKTAKPEVAVVESDPLPQLKQLELPVVPESSSEVTDDSGHDDTQEQLEALMGA